MHTITTKYGKYKIASACGEMAGRCSKKELGNNGEQSPQVKGITWQHAGFVMPNGIYRLAR